MTNQRLVPSLPMRGRAEISKRVQLSIKERRLLSKLATERELLCYAEMPCDNTCYREGIA